MHLLSSLWAHSQVWGPGRLQHAHPTVCAVPLQQGMARPAWAGLAAAPPWGTLCSSRSTESFQLTITSFQKSYLASKYRRLFSLGTAEMFKVCLPEMTGICLKCFLKRHNNTTIVLDPKMQKLKSSDVKQCWKPHGNIFSLELRPKIKNVLPEGY